MKIVKIAVASLAIAGITATSSLGAQAEAAQVNAKVAEEINISATKYRSNTAWKSIRQLCDDAKLTVIYISSTNIVEISNPRTGAEREFTENQLLDAGARKVGWTWEMTKPSFDRLLTKSGLTG